MHIMKTKLILVSVLLAISSNTLAQSIRTVKNYSHTANITVSSTEATINVDGKSKAFALSKVNNLLVLNDPEGAMQYLQLSAENQASLKAQYDTAEGGKYKNATVVNQIINRAQALKSMVLKGDATVVNASTGSSLQVVDDANNVADPTADNNNETLDIENSGAETAGEFTEAKTEKTFFEENWIKLVGLITALLLGLTIGRMSKANACTVDVEEEETEEAVQTTVGKKTAKPKQVNLSQLKEINKKNALEVKTLKQEIKLHATKLKEVQMQMQNAEQEQKQIFDAVRTKVTAPYIKAVETNNQSDIIAYALRATAHLISLERNNKTMREGFDIANMDALIKNAPLNGQTIINNKTPADDVPKNIQAIKNALEHNNIADLSDVSIFGYIIKRG